MSTSLFKSLLLAVSLVFSGNFTVFATHPPSYRTQSKAVEALAYCKANGFNTNYCVLIDMSLHSGKKRLFVYDFKNDSLMNSGLCSHGCCAGLWGVDWTKTKPKFNNIPNSHCSSLGKYKIGNRGYSNFGIHVNYKLHGLEPSNSKAYERYIVLHSWSMISDDEPYPKGTAEGWGCPAVSNAQMTYLDGLLKKTTKPVLLWIYQ